MIELSLFGKTIIVNIMSSLIFFRWLRNWWLIWKNLQSCTERVCLVKKTLSWQKPLYSKNSAVYVFTCLSNFPFFLFLIHSAKQLLVCQRETRTHLAEWISSNADHSVYSCWDRQYVYFRWMAMLLTRRRRIQLSEHQIHIMSMNW